MKGFELTLPFPPSINGYWRAIVRGNHATQITSARGRSYREEVKWIAGRIPAENRFDKDDRIFVEIHLHCPRRGLDLDNHAKAALDALTHAGAWPDDSQIDLLLIQRGDKTGKPGSLDLWATPIEMEA